jgi:hypothetical protein
MLNRSQLNARRFRKKTWHKNFYLPNWRSQGMLSPSPSI